VLIIDSDLHILLCPVELNSKSGGIEFKFGSGASPSKLAAAGASGGAVAGGGAVAAPAGGQVVPKAVEKIPVSGIALALDALASPTAAPVAPMSGSSNGNRSRTAGKAGALRPTLTVRERSGSMADGGGSTPVRTPSRSSSWQSHLSAAGAGAGAGADTGEPGMRTSTHTAAVVVSIACTLFSSEFQPLGFENVSCAWCVLVCA
jgi:hypothetical protein